MAKSSGKNGRALRDELAPLRRYLKNWSADRLDAVDPTEARRLLTLVQEIEQGLFKVEHALGDRAFVSQGLR
jgi:hypothetical protein